MADEYCMFPLVDKNMPNLHFIIAVTEDINTKEHNVTTCMATYTSLSIYSGLERQEEGQRKVRGIISTPFYSGANANPRVGVSISLFIVADINVIV